MSSWQFWRFTKKSFRFPDEIQNNRAIEMCGDEVLCKSILSRCFICTFIIWDSTSYRYSWRWPLSSFIHEKQGGLMGLFHLENTPQNHEFFIISSSIFLIKCRLRCRFLHIYLSIHDDFLTWKLKGIIKILLIHTYIQKHFLHEKSR